MHRMWMTDGKYSSQRGHRETGTGTGTGRVKVAPLLLEKAQWKTSHFKEEY